MKLSELAKSINLSQTKVKEISVQLLGTIPTEYSELEITKIKEHLAIASNPQLTGAMPDSKIEQLELPPVTGERVDSVQVTGGITNSNPDPIKQLTLRLQTIAQEEVKIARIRETLGKDTLSKNIGIWGAFIQYELREAEHAQNKLLLEFQYKTNKNTLETFGAMHQGVVGAANNFKKAVNTDVNQILNSMVTEHERSLEALKNLEFTGYSNPELDAEILADLEYFWKLS